MLLLLRVMGNRLTAGFTIETVEIGLITEFAAGTGL